MSTAQDRSPFLLRQLDVREYFLEMNFRDHRTQLICIHRWVPHFHGIRGEKEGHESGAPSLFASPDWSPPFMAFVLSTNSFLNFSYNGRSIKMREPHRHISPWLENEELILVLIAFSKLQSEKMMFGFFPPSSSESFLNMGAAVAAMAAPVFVPPVNDMSGILG